MIAPGTCPAISVITPCLNGARFIAEAVESVLTQGHSNVEHIVADGGSTDGTLEILDGYDHLTVLSCADRGMYDGLNRALSSARGEIIGLLNSDDCYARNAFSLITNAFRDVNVTALAAGAETFRHATNAAEVIVERFSPVGTDVLFRATLGNPFINACFFRASVFSKLGPFDADYRIAGDREFMLRFACSGLGYAQTDTVAYRYRMHSSSMTFGGTQQTWDTILSEHSRIAGRYLRDRTLSDRERQMVKRAHTRDTLQAALYSTRQRAPRMLLHYATTGTRHDPLWPVRFARRALGGLIRKVGPPAPSAQT